MESGVARLKAGMPRGPYPHAERGGVVMGEEV